MLAFHDAHVEMTMFNVEGPRQPSLDKYLRVLTLLCSRSQVFGPSASQLDVFNGAVLPLVADVCAGLNAAVLAYGATDTGKCVWLGLWNTSEHCTATDRCTWAVIVAGKTFTMQGDTTNPNLFGMIPRALQLVWDTMRSQSRAFRISVSMIEVRAHALLSLLS